MLVWMGVFRKTYFRLLSTWYIVLDHCCRFAIRQWMLIAHSVVDVALDMLVYHRQDLNDHLVNIGEFLYQTIKGSRGTAMRWNRNICLKKDIENLSWRFKLEARSLNNNRYWQLLIRFYGNPKYIIFNTNTYFCLQDPCEDKPKSWSKNCPTDMKRIVTNLVFPTLLRSTLKSFCVTAFGGGRSGNVPGNPRGVSCLPSCAYSGSKIEMTKFDHVALYSNRTNMVPLKYTIWS